MSRQGEFPRCKGSNHAMEGALQRRAKQGFCAQSFLSTCHRNAGLLCEARAASSTSAQKKTEEPRRTPLGEHVKTERISVTQGADPCHGRCSAEACQGPLCRSKSIPAEVLSAAKKSIPVEVLSAAQSVYLQRSCLPTRDDACKGPLCCPKGVPTEVLSAHRNDAYRGPLCRTGGIPAEVLSARPR